MDDKKKTFWEKVIAGLILISIVGGFTFYSDVSSMMRVYQVDKFHSDKTRKELVIAIKQLNSTMVKISTKIAVQEHRLGIIEKDVAKLKVTQ
jgi:hypothetical protein